MRLLTAGALAGILLTQQAPNPRDVVLVGATVYTDPESPQERHPLIANDG